MVVGKPAVLLDGAHFLLPSRFRYLLKPQIPAAADAEDTWSAFR